MQSIYSSSLISKKLKIKIYRTIILFVVLYGCETGSLILREKRKLRVLEIRVLKRLFGPKWNEVTRKWIKLNNDELKDLYSSPNIVQVIKSMRWAGHVARIGVKRSVYRVLMGKPEGKGPLGSSRLRWEDNINPALGWWGITNPSHIFCYAIMVFGNTVFFPPVYRHLI